LDRKVNGILLSAILAIVFTTSLVYTFSQPNQTQNIPSPLPTTTPAPVPSSTQTPSPSESEEQIIPASESPSISSPSGEQIEHVSIPKPSVPEFTVRYLDYSHDVPPVYGVDQYTGKTVITKEGYHVNNRTVEFTIKNQPFTSYIGASGNNIELYYNFRFKGYYGNEWSYYPFKPDGYSTIPYGMLTGDLSPKLFPSNTDYTSISINLDILLSISSGYTGSFSFPSDGQMEFQTQALVGHVGYEASGLIAGSYYTFRGETSNWSETQIITLP
jgi:hypothetical protein